MLYLRIRRPGVRIPPSAQPPKQRKPCLTSQIQHFCDHGQRVFKHPVMPNRDKRKPRVLASTTPS